MSGWLLSYGDDGRVTETEVRAGLVPLIAGLGGGWNSTAGLIEMRRRDIVPDLIVFADTGGTEGLGEKPGTYAHLWELQGWCERVGFPPIWIVINESPESGWRSLEDECLRKPTLPSRVAGGSSCAQKWKHDPMSKHLTSWNPDRCGPWADKKWIKAIGYDGGEEGRASTLEDKRLRYWYPLIEWDISRERCRDIILSEGLTLPPKSACFYCPSSTKAEVLWLAETHPDLFARAVELERRGLPEFDKIRGLGRHWSWEALVAADPAVRAGWIEAPVERCMQCDDGGCEIEDLPLFAANRKSEAA